MDTLPLLDFIERQMVQGDRDGETFDRARDRERLDTSAERIFAVLKDKQWHCLRELADAGQCEPQTASARVRDLRKPEHGHWRVDRRHVERGKFEYRWTGEKA